MSNTRRRSFQPNRRQVIQGAGGLAAMAAFWSPATHRAFAQDEQITLDYWNWWDVQRQELMDNIIADFQEEFPNITVNNVPQTWDRRDEVVTTALAGGDPPEVIMVSRQEIVKFADSGAIAPITSFVEEAGLDLDRYYQSEIESMWWNDELYALPMPTAGGETGLYFYNEQLFEEAGLDPANPPETWAEFDEATAALTQLADNGAIEIPGSNLSLSAPGFLAMLYTNNGTLYSDDLKSVTWNSQEGIDTLTWMFEYVQRHFGGHQNWMDWSNAIQPGERRFDQGRLAMEFQNVSAFFHIKNNAPDLRYGVHFRPYNSDNPDAKSQGVAALTFGWGYVIPSSHDEATQAAAFEFIKRITYDDAAAEFMLQQERPSPLKDANENPEYAEINPHWDKVVQSMENDVSVGIVPVQSEIMSVLTDYIELVAFEEMSPEEGLNTAAEEAQGILDDYWSSAS
jgi:multiple sugar transport system substrate-binding protein